MKERLLRFLSRLPQQSRRLVSLYPVETALVVLGWAGWMLMYHFRWDEEFIPRLVLFPLFALVSLAVNNFAGSGPWCRIYWVCWAPLIPLLLWPGLDDWAEDGRLLVTLGLLVPLALLMCRRAVQNDRFVAEGLVWLRSAFLAGLFANVTLGLFLAILYSTVYIFSLGGAWTEPVTVYALIFAEAFCVPVLFLAMADRWRSAVCRGGRVAEVLLNYIVTPALLIYAFILSLYILKIVAVWSLPRGGVAYLVFGYMLTALAVQALQCLLAKRIYGWFFDRFSLLSLPVLVLFWAGVLQRVTEYGLTPPRVWLVACGVLMTLCVVLMLWPRTGRYLWVSLAGFVIFGSLVFIPPMYPERIAQRSQARRAANMDAEPAREKSMRVMLSVSDAISIPLSGDYGMLYAQLPESDTQIPGYTFSADTLRLHLDTEVLIPAARIVESCLQKTGTADPSEQMLRDSTQRLLIYEQGNVTVVFTSLTLEKDAGPWRIDWLTVGSVLTR